jgi:hypothetical protein
MKADRMSAGNHHPGFIEGDDCPEQNLWLAVIALAVNDYALFRNAKTAAIRSLSEDARVWLFGSEDSDFREVCDRAGVAPEFVRSSAHRMLKERSDWDWTHDGAYVVGMKVLPREQCKQPRQSKGRTSTSAQLCLRIGASS